MNGGSVATAAFAFMRFLKQKRIILIGQDLASANGVTHAGGDNDNTRYNETTVEGYYGGTVTTRSDWLGYLRWFEREIQTINENDEGIRVIDATEGGAKIHGAEIMTLQQAIDECRDSTGVLPDYHFDEEIKKMDYSIKEDDYNLLINEFKKSVEKLNDMAKESENAVYICKKLIERIEKDSVSASYVDKEKKKLTGIIQKCSKMKIFPLVDHYLITNVMDDIIRLRYSEGDIKTTELNGIKLMKMSFEAISETAKTIYKRAQEIEAISNKG